MADHAGEEDRVEPRERAGEASDQAPVEREIQITGVVNLASFAIYRTVSAIPACWEVI